MTTPAGKSGTFRLGELTVNRLGFGAMRLTGTGGMGRGEARDPEQSAAVVRRAVELGVNHVDTAGFYFSATCSANEVIRAALAPYPDDVVVVTKVGPTRDRTTGEFGDWATPGELRRHVEDNLTELELDQLHVVNYRSLGPRDDVPAAVEALAALRDEGLLRHVGLSNVDVGQLAAARELTEIVCVQNRHAPGYERSDAEAVIDACAQAGIAFVPFFTIAGRSREDAAEEQYDVVQAIADRHSATPAQVRIAWTLALGAYVLAIPGTGDVGHLEQNVAAAELRLTDEDLVALGGLGE